METTLAKAVSEGIKSLYGKDVEPSEILIQKTRKEFAGDLTVVVFPLLKISGKNPIETGNEIGNFLVEKLSEVQSYNVVKGFLNLEFEDAYWSNQLMSISKSKDIAPKLNDDTMMVEYSSPNTNKPLHLGHLRNIFLGHSVSTIVDETGGKVVRTQIINDRGIHICKSMIAWLKFGNGETPQTAGVKGDKLVGKYYVEFDKAYKAEIEELVQGGMPKEEAEREAPIFKEAQAMLKDWEAGKEDVVELWKTMNGWCYEGFEKTYDLMGVSFDKLYYESDTYILGKSVVEEGLEKGVFYRKDDGSVWCDLTEEGLDHKLVLRSDGTAVYMTQDIGTAIERYRDYPDLAGIIYTVGNEQDYHFKVLFLILKKLGYPWAEKCYHLSYGMVDLPTGKMKSREGTVVDADDLMLEMISEAKKSTEELGKLEGLEESEKEDIYRMVGLGALKYFLLKVDPKKRMMFNPEESIDFQGNTGPFIQYAHARICSILRRVDANKHVDTNTPLNEHERALIKVLSQYPEALTDAAANYSPAVIANYTYELVKTFNQLYQSSPIVKEEDENIRARRIVLCEQTGRIIKHSMAMLGIEVPERM